MEKAFFFKKFQLMNYEIQLRYKELLLIKKRLGVEDADIST